VDQFKDSEMAFCSLDSFTQEKIHSPFY